MTKEEARQSLFNTKVYVNGKSKEIQEKLFELGFKWSFGKEVGHTDKPFLYLKEDETLSCGNDMEFYKNNKAREVSEDYILNLKWDEEFKDGDILSYSNDPMCVFIYKSGGTASNFYCGITSNGMYFQSTLNITLGMNGNEDKELLVLASEEQKDRLFNEMKRRGKRWNAEFKQIEEMISCKLKPFDRVLGRDTDEGEWTPDIFREYLPGEKFCYPYQCIGMNYLQCIPYDGNEDKLK